MLTIRKTSAIRANRHEIQNKQSEATAYLYGDIGGFFGIDHLEFIKEFNAIDAATIHLRVDSSGGDVFAARAIKTALMQHKAKVVAHIDGLAASAASSLIMGADEIEIVDGGFLMIHNAMSFMDIFGYFNADDLQKLFDDIGKEKELHAKINEAIAADYSKKSANSIEKILGWMAAETWFTAKEAVENKFADRVYDGKPVEGSYDLSVFAKTPQALKERNSKLSKRTLEKALRDVGLSNKETKKILAVGFKDDLRDEVPPADPPPAIVDQRDVEPPKPKKDRIADLLTRAEVFAPSTN